MNVDEIDQGDGDGNDTPVSGHGARQRRRLSLVWPGQARLRDRRKMGSGDLSGLLSWWLSRVCLLIASLDHLLGCCGVDR